MPVEPKISPEQLKKLLAYDPTTGNLWWIVSRGSITKGTFVLGDYIKINGVSYVKSRVIWCLHYNEWPPIDMLVDHRNRIHGDNRIDNLRLATPTQNSQNKAGYAGMPKGVYIRDRISKPYAARISINGVLKELGSYATCEEAAEAYRKACLEYHGEFACHD